MQRCTCRPDTLLLIISSVHFVTNIVLTAKSYCTNCKHTSGKSIAKDQRTSQSCSESIGLCKNPSVKHMVGRMAAEVSECFGVESYLQLIDHKSRTKQLHTYQGKFTPQLLWPCTRLSPLHKNFDL